MPRYTWTHTRDNIWQLHIAGRVDPVYSIACTRRPTHRETLGIVQRLRAYYPWIWRTA